MSQIAVCGRDLARLARLLDTQLPEKHLYGQAEISIKKF